MGYYLHNVPGRLRLKSPFFKNRETHDNIKRCWPVSVELRLLISMLQPEAFLYIIIPPRSRLNTL